MSSYVNFAVAEAHRQDLLRAAERSHVMPKAPKVRFSLFESLRSATSKAGKTRLASAAELAVARGA